MEQILEYAVPPTRASAGRTLMEANAQWSYRPDDQRYVKMVDLLDAVVTRRERSEEFNHVNVKDNLQANVVMEGPHAGELYTLSDAGQPVIFTNWSFSQYNSAVGGPNIQWLRDMPAPVAKMALNASLKYRERVGDDSVAKLLIAPPYGDEPGILRALTSPTYGRIWDEEVVRTVMAVNHDGRWVVPGKVAGRGMADMYTEVSKRSTTLYASDRDVWMFLVDEEHPVEIDGDLYFKGMIVSNSEVGNAVFSFKSFLFRAACMNRIIHQAFAIRELRIRHTSGAPTKFLEGAAPALAAYSEASPRGIVEAVHQAKRVSVADTLEDAQQFLREQGFNAYESQLFPIVAERSEEVGSSGDPTNLWDLVMAGTAYARELQYADVRVQKEEQVSRL